MLWFGGCRVFSMWRLCSCVCARVYVFLVVVPFFPCLTAVMLAPFILCSSMGLTTACNIQVVGMRKRRQGNFAPQCQFISISLLSESCTTPRNQLTSHLVCIMCLETSCISWIFCETVICSLLVVFSPAGNNALY